MTSRNRPTKNTGFFVPLISIAAILGVPAAAEETPGEEHVCVAKTDSTGGRLGFIARGSDAALFEGAGFERVTCPEDLALTATKLAERCARFRALDDVGKQMIRELYGLSVEEMCTASDAWAATQN